MVLKKVAAKTCEEPEFSKPAEPKAAITHYGQLIVDATACPQDISFPTDLNLLNDAREKLEELIDV